jgi:hypothetical protein
VTEQRAHLVLPDHDSKWQLHPDAGIGLHQRRSGARIAEQDDLLGRQLHSGLACGGGMVDAREHRQAPVVDRLDEALGRGGIARAASSNDHARIFLRPTRRCEPVT